MSSTDSTNLVLDDQDRLALDLACRITAWDQGVESTNRIPVWAVNLAAELAPYVRGEQSAAWDAGEKAGYVHGQYDTNRLEPGPDYEETPNPYGIIQTNEKHQIR